MDALFRSEPHQDPSALSKRLPAAALAMTGCGIATYLALYQLGIVAHVWEPFFGDGSRVILKESAVTHLLPVPDAALGAGAYLLEAVAECVGGRQRWRTWPAAVFATGAVAAGLGLAAVVLVACQAFWFQAYCTLCLASAACSLVLGVFVAPELGAAVGRHKNFSRRPPARGESGASAARTDGMGRT
jgi:uncharacterized membrane protein